MTDAEKQPQSTDAQENSPNGEKVKDESGGEDFVVVQDEDATEPMELPVVGTDRALHMTTLTATFPGAHGLKFKNPKTGASRAVALDATGTKFLPPPDGWEGKTFIVIYPSRGEAKRRKVESDDEEDDEGTVKQKRMDQPSKPVDLIVLGVNYSTSPEAFKQHFEKFGKVAAADLKHNFEGKSKGFGFIMMSTIEEQKKVLAEAHVLDGRKVEVRVPDSRSEHFRNPLLPREQSTNKVFVGRLPDTTTEELREFFESEAKKLNEHATITDVFVPRPFRGFGFVTFTTCEMARRICQANNLVLKGNPLAVSLAVPREPLEGDRGMGMGKGGYGDRDRAPPFMSYGAGAYNSSAYGYGGGPFMDAHDWSRRAGPPPQAQPPQTWRAPPLGPPPSRQVPQAPPSSTLANGMDALNLSNSRSSHPDVFNAAWQVFMNSVKPQQSNNVPQPRGPPPPGGPPRWK